MKTLPTSRYIAFFDECGDHSLEKIDPDFPLFVLSTVVIERRAYIEQVIPALSRLKLQFWSHEGVNLHSRDIRKALGDFAFMQVPALRQQLLAALSTIIRDVPFTLFISAVQKDSHKRRHGPAAGNPYDLALARTLESLVPFLEAEGETLLPITAEARGRLEDLQLGAAFYRMMQEGTAALPPARFQPLDCPITFRRKTDNIAGLQIADLCAHPAARRLLNPSQPNQAFDAVSSHLYDRGGVSGWHVTA
jgi:hypothetical protein